MTIKKLLLLLCAMVAFAGLAPVAAQAEEDPLWYAVEGEEETLIPEVESEEEMEAEVAVPFNFNGEISVTSAFKTGPCAIAGNGTAVNFNKMAAGAIQAVQIAGGGECGTSLPSCKATSITAANLPWPFTVKRVGGKEVVEFSKVTIKTLYNAACEAFGVPAEVNVAGKLTGEFKTGTATFVKAGDLFVEGAPTPVTVDGELNPGAGLKLK